MATQWQSLAQSTYIRLVLFSVFCFFSFPQCASIPPAQPGKSRQPTQLHPFSSRQGSSFWIKLHSVFFFLFLCCVLLFVSLSYFIIHFSSFFFHILLAGCETVSLPRLLLNFSAFSTRSFVRSCAALSLLIESPFVGIVDFILLFFPYFLWLAPLLCTCRIAKERKREIELYVYIHHILDVIYIRTTYIYSASLSTIDSQPPARIKKYSNQQRGENRHQSYRRASTISRMKHNSREEMNFPLHMSRVL